MCMNSLKPRLQASGADRRGDVHHLQRMRIGHFDPFCIGALIAFVGRKKHMLILSPSSILSLAMIRLPRCDCEQKKRRSFRSIVHRRLSISITGNCGATLHSILCRPFSLLSPFIVKNVVSQLYQHFEAVRFCVLRQFDRCICVCAMLAYPRLDIKQSAIVCMECHTPSIL